jgi:hypothetical protein
MTEPTDGYLAKEDAKRCLTLATPGGEPQTWVPLDLFQAVQNERDEFRRVLGLIGAWRSAGMESVNDLDRLLLRGGFDLAACRAVLDVVRWAAENRPDASKKTEG